MNELAISKKRFLKEAKHYKQRYRITAPESRDQMARKYGFRDFDDLFEHQVKSGVWSD